MLVFVAVAGTVCAARGSVKRVRSPVRAYIGALRLL